MSTPENNNNNNNNNNTRCGRGDGTTTREQHRVKISFNQVESGRIKIERSIG